MNVNSVTQHSWTLVVWNVHVFNEWALTALHLNKHNIHVICKIRHYKNYKRRGTRCPKQIDLLSEVWFGWRAGSWPKSHFKRWDQIKRPSLTEIHRLVTLGALWSHVATLWFEWKWSVLSDRSGVHFLRVSCLFPPQQVSRSARRRWAHLFSQRLLICIAPPPPRAPFTCCGKCPHLTDDVETKSW